VGCGKILVGQHSGPTAHWLTSLVIMS